MSVRRLISVAAAVLLLCMQWPAAAQDTKAQESRKARLEKEIADIDRLLRENGSRSKSALSDLTLIQRQIVNRKELIAESDRQIDSVQRAIADKQAGIDLMQRRLDTLSYYYARLVKNSYKNRDSRKWYMYILASENIGQAFRRFGYLKNLSNEMNGQAAKIKEMKASLEQEKAALESMKEQFRAIRDARRQEVASLQTEEDNYRKVVTGLRRDERKYRQELAKKRREVEALNREIAAIIRKAAASGSGKGTGKAAEADIKLSGEFANNKGRLPWPVSGTVVEGFGQHYHPVFKNVKLPFNNGVTIAVARDAEVKAVFDGIVRQIVVMPGYSQCVLVQHGEYFTFYCKLKNVAVRSGEKITLGQTIGTVDTVNGENQLHFELWSGRTPQNPETWLRR